MRPGALTLSILVLIPLTASADWKKPYFGSTPVGSWATYTTKASAGAPSVTTSSRLADRVGRVRLEDRNSYPGKEYPPSAQRYELAPGFTLDRDLLDFAKSLVASSSSTNGGAFAAMPAASVQMMKDAATPFGTVAVFVKTETVNGKESDHYRYSVRNEATKQTEAGDLWLSDAVPFGLVKRSLTSKDDSGSVIWSMEQDLTDFGMAPKEAMAATAVPKSQTKSQTLKGAAILEHPCGKVAVTQMGLVHAGNMDAAMKLSTKEMQDQWKAMPATDRTMMSGMMKEMSQTEAQFAADIKASGLLVVDGQAATLTLKTTTTDANGTSTSTTKQSFKLDGGQCLISR
jgi:hypothetical protein